MLGDVVVPEDPIDAVTPIDGVYDQPSTVDDQLRWLEAAVGSDPASTGRSATSPSSSPIRRPDAHASERPDYFGPPRCQPYLCRLRRKHGDEVLGGGRIQTIAEIIARAAPGRPCDSSPPANASGSMTCATAVQVALIRARDRAYIVVPTTVHPLWRPLIETCERLPRLQLREEWIVHDDSRRGILPLGSGFR